MIALPLLVPRRRVGDRICNSCSNLLRPYRVELIDRRHPALCRLCGFLLHLLDLRQRRLHAPQRGSACRGPRKHRERPTGVKRRRDSKKLQIVIDTVRRKLVRLTVLIVVAIFIAAWLADENSLDEPAEESAGRKEAVLWECEMHRNVPFALSRVVKGQNDATEDGWGAVGQADQVRIAELEDAVRSIVEERVREGGKGGRRQLEHGSPVDAISVTLADDDGEHGVVGRHGGWHCRRRGGGVVGTEHDDPSLSEKMTLQASCPF
ncbi:hypothetical protein DFJ73DRAFT_805281 [Zopfochytrium polystomum]|nr:hypothetical protein DFJ73DRAFT_805281 [Zopfochytrium polystomum]